MNSRFRALAPVMLAVLVAPVLLARPQGGVDKSLFVSVLDENGRPVRQFTQGQRSTYWCSYCQK